MTEQIIQKPWKRNFYTIWAGQAVSILTSSVVQMALIWHLANVSNSAAVLSVASIVGFLPMAVFGSFAGTLVDRWKRKTTLIGADMFIATASLVLVIYAMFAELPIWLIMVILAVRSVGSAFHSPAISAVTPLMVPEEELTKCAGYTQSLQTVGNIIGLAIATILYPIWSLSAIIFLDVIGALAASAAVLIISVPELPKAQTQEARPKQRLWAETVEGYRILRTKKGLFALLWIGVGYMIFFSPINALFPLMSKGHFMGEMKHATIAEIAFSVGMLGGGALLGMTGGFKNRAISILGAMFLLGAAIALSGLLPSTAYWVFAVLCVVMGFSVPFYNGPHMALMQEKIAPEYLGRVFGLYTSIMSLAMPVGLAFSALLADRISVPVWFIISGAGCTLLAILAAAMPTIMNIEKTT